jgi:Kef-type K+ transport system membrane component KefB
MTSSSLAALAAVLLTATVIGAGFRRLGQPAVIGQILGGLLLGPTVLGAIPGDPSAALFSPTTRTAIEALGEAGVVCYVFTLGLELNLAAVRERGRLVCTVSAAALLTPFLLALPLGLALYSSDRTAAMHGIGELPFVLYIGLVFSITAVPVLASIIADRGLAGMRIARIALVCAVAQDFAVWVLLAVILTLVRAGHGGGHLLELVAESAGLLLALTVVRWLLRRRARAGGSAAQATISGLAGCAVLSAAASSAIGLQPIVGAVLCGMTLGAGIGREQRQLVLRNLRPPIEGLLLPAYFLAPGLAIDLRTIGAGGLAMITGMVALATVGKVGGGALASRLCGLSWRQAGVVGTLMNARGLVELIVLRVGYSAGLISARLLGELVATAVLTTVMTGPLLNLVGDGTRQRAVVRELDLPALPQAAKP